MDAPAPILTMSDDTLFRAIARHSGALPAGFEVPAMQAALIRATAEHCAALGDGYSRGLGDATAGDHIRAMFGL